jgi:hypothetical protein
MLHYETWALSLVAHPLFRLSSQSMRSLQTRPYTHLPLIVLILLLAAFFRLHQLPGIPPGLTHDEADHLLDAWGVVNGIRPVYFTVGYGREPLFDYSTAVLMRFLGPTYLAGRLTAVFYSLILLAGSYAWTRRVFGSRTALLTAAGLAVSFWAVMIGRHNLRTITQPALFILALALWQMAVAQGATSRRRYSLAAAAGLFLGLTFYTYFPARIIWLLLPAATLLTSFGKEWKISLLSSPFSLLPSSFAFRPLLVTLLTAALVAAPLFIYLAQNRDVEERLTELSGPLTAVRQSDLQPLLQNSRDSLLLLTIRGDSQWRYNIPGRPFVDAPLIPFFYLGVLLCLTNLTGFGKPVRFLLLLWLFLGWLPSLITGPELSATRLSGLQPVLYVFPALGLSWLWRFLEQSRPNGKAPKFFLRQNGRSLLIVGLIVVLYGATAVISYRDYFHIWGQHPEVRVQYESSLVAALGHIEREGLRRVAIATTTPERFHSPAVAQAVLGREADELGWFDGRRSLLLPAGEGHLILTQFAALDERLQPYLPASVSRREIPLPPDDLDRPLWLVASDGRWAHNWRVEMAQTIVSPADQLPLSFDGAAVLLGYDLSSAAAPGETIEIVTLWRAVRPFDDGVIFVQLIGGDGLPLAQEDRLDVPSRSWREGDHFLQLHQFAVPTGAPPGDYPLYLGLYQRGGPRLPVIVDGAAVADFIHLQQLAISD